MKKVTIIFATFFVALLFSGCSSNSDPAVKKSNAGICHEKGTNFYDNTKNFTAYTALSDCLASGGRLPKK